MDWSQDELEDEAMETPAAPGQRVGLWVRGHLPLVLFAALLITVMFCRGYWSPDEPDFAQCVKEMRERGEWLLPYLNGQPYSEKPILFYWFMKVSAIVFEKLSGGLGFQQGIAAWALRLPSVLASIAFVAAFHRWALRFLQKDVANLAVIILATTPLWFWQSQFIQIDLLFAALVAWAWLCWLAGYLLLRGQTKASRENEQDTWFLKAYVFLALAFLAKGPLALVLDFLVLGAFLAWQRDFKALRSMRLGTGTLLFLLVAAPWSVMMAMKAGPQYVYELLIHQNFERATHAWDHIQPWYQYGVYMLGDFFPWVLLLPALGFFFVKGGAHRAPLARFLALAWLVPFLFLSWVESKQGKYLLVAYPFLALLLAAMLQPLAVEGVSGRRIRRLGGVLGLGLGLLAGALLAVAFGAGGAKLQTQMAPFHTLIRVMAFVATMGALSVATRAAVSEGRFLVREAGITIGLLFLLGGTWGFRMLDPQKDTQRWTAGALPLMQGHRVYFWDEIRSGAMLYTDIKMPEVLSDEGLLALKPGDRLVVIESRWEPGHLGLKPGTMSSFQPLLKLGQGGDTWMLMERR
ncbi:MAG TPA: glycosyltransferase family 39 protein [Holophagaceae bacterium]|jgi:4-amino-4-deoxy-L-arabinose transferase-like glycosyltransferase|nr:glycosyltransferase family 39 protein [Holophagaceae bacterium]